MTETGRAEKGTVSLTEAAELRFLEAEKLRFNRHGADLRLTIDGERSCLRVELLRAFPLTSPRKHISVREAGGDELGVLKDLDALESEQRTLAEEELQRRYLVPEIRKVLEIKERFGCAEWEVETDRGRCKFTTQNLRENVARPSPHRLILTDADGNRYDVKDLDKLDPRSRDLVLGQL